MDNRKEKSFEEMYREDYINFFFPDVKTIATDVVDLKQAADVTSNVSNKIVDIVNKSGNEYQEYLQNNPMSETIPETLKALGTGIASGAIGIGGDVEMIGTGLLRVLQTKEGQSKLEAFLQGLEQDTILPTTDDVAKRIKGVVGDTAKGTGFVEGIGEVVSPTTLATKTASKLAKTLKNKITKTPVETKASEVLIKTEASEPTVKIEALEPTVKTEASVETKNKKLEKTSKEKILRNVDEIPGISIGPGGVVKPVTIEKGNNLYRETNVDGLNSLLWIDRRYEYNPMFVSNSKELAIGQNENKGIKITFRPNSLSGKENIKPGTTGELGNIFGKEYKTDIIAPEAIQEITVNSIENLKGINNTSKNILNKKFNKIKNQDNSITFIRKE